MRIRISMKLLRRQRVKVLLRNRLKLRLKVLTVNIKQNQPILHQNHSLLRTQSNHLPLLSRRRRANPPHLKLKTSTTLCLSVMMNRKKQRSKTQQLQDLRLENCMKRLQTRPRQLLVRKLELKLLVRNPHLRQVLVVEGHAPSHPVRAHLRILRQVIKLRKIRLRNRMVLPIVRKWMLLTQANLRSQVKKQLLTKHKLNLPASLPR